MERLERFLTSRPVAVAVLAFLAFKMYTDPIETLRKTVPVILLLVVCALIARRTYRPDGPKGSA